MYLNILDSHIISLKGQDCLSALSSRIEKQHESLSSVWIDLLSEKLPQNILEILGTAITEIDSDDIRPKLIPLRIHGPSAGIFCKLLRVIFE